MSLSVSGTDFGAGGDSLQVGVANVAGTTVTAGTYACGTIGGSQVNQIIVGAGGVTYSTVADGTADCSITIDADATQGSHFSGSFSGLLGNADGTGTTVQVAGTFSLPDTDG